MLKRTMRATAVAGLAAAAVTVPAQAAHAVPGPCYGMERTTTSYQAWCDGTGPTSYRAWVYCTNRKTYYGQWRWHGDRRGSTAVCQEGTNIWRYGTSNRG